MHTSQMNLDYIAVARYNICPQKQNLKKSKVNLMLAIYEEYN